MLGKLIDGFSDLKDSMSAVQLSRQIRHRGGVPTVTKALWDNLTRSSEWTWKLAKSDYVEVAVQVAVAGNTLMMLAKDETFENRGWRGVSESSSSDENESLFCIRHRCICDVCGNNRCVCNNCAPESDKL